MEATNLAKWLIVGSVPALAWLVGALALPRPLPVAAEKEAVDRDALGAAVSRIRPTPKVPADAELGDAVKILGADLPEAPVARGARLSARFFFEARDELDRDWQIFLHIDARAGSYRIHGDHWPVGGKYHTSLWRPGDFVADSWSTVVPREAPPGPYDVWLGFYIGDERLPFTGGAPASHDGSNRVRVGTIAVE
jgi:hypothetical protein